MIIFTAAIFYHPMIWLFIILILIQLIANNFLWSRARSGDVNRIYLLNQKRFEIILAFTIVIFTYWYIEFSSFTGSVKNVLSAFTDFGQNSGTISIFARSTGTIEHTSASLFLIIERFIQWYGPVTLYIAGGIVCLFCIGWALKNKQADATEILFAELFFSSIIFGLILTFSFIGMNELIRTLSFAIVMATILIGLAISNRYEQIISDKRKSLMNIVLISMISFSAIFGLLIVFPSPWVGIASSSMGPMEISGYNWFLENRNGDYPLYMNEISTYKYNTYAFTSDPLITEKKDVDISQLPGHFGYNNYTTISMSLKTRSGYVAVREYDFTYYYAISENLRENQPIFTDSDYNRLEYDDGVEKLYTNREFELWQLI